MFVRLQDSPKGPAGKWTDAATSEHGDLLDIIRESLGLRDFREVAEEARRFLNLPRAEPQPVLKSVRPPAVARSQEAARRLFAISQPIEGTVVEAYLQRRGSPTCAMAVACASTRVATIDPMIIRQPRPGRQ